MSDECISVNGENNINDHNIIKVYTWRLLKLEKKDKIRILFYNTIKSINNWWL